MASCPICAPRTASQMPHYGYDTHDAYQQTCPCGSSHHYHHHHRRRHTGASQPSISGGLQHDPFQAYGFGVQRPSWEAMWETFTPHTGMYSSSHGRRNNQQQTWYDNDDGQGDMTYTFDQLDIEDYRDNHHWSDARPSHYPQPSAYDLDRLDGLVHSPQPYSPPRSQSFEPTQPGNDRYDQHGTGHRLDGTIFHESYSVPRPSAREATRQAWMDTPRQGPPPFDLEYAPTYEDYPTHDNSSGDRVDWFIQNHTIPAQAQEASQLLNQECPICLQSLEEHPCVQISNIHGCKHMIGRDCLRQLLGHSPGSKKTCPLCRAVFLPEDGIWEDDPRLELFMSMGGSSRIPPSFPAMTDRHPAWVDLGDNHAHPPNSGLQSADRRQHGGQGGRRNGAGRRRGRIHPFEHIFAERDGINSRHHRRR